MWQLSNSWPNQFQNNLNLTWPSNTAGISLDSRLEYSKITHRYAKVSPFTWFLCWTLPIDTDFIHFICHFHQAVTKNTSECFDGPAAPQQGMLGALIFWWPASFRLQWTMAEGTVHTGSPAKFPTKPTEEWKKLGKCTCMPIGLSPGSRQTSLGLGSMSRYSAMTGCISTPWYPIYVHIIIWYHTPRYSTYCIQTSEAVFVVNCENQRSVIIEWVINAYISGHSEMPHYGMDENHRHFMIEWIWNIWLWY